MVIVSSDSADSLGTAATVVNRLQVLRPDLASPRATRWCASLPAVLSPRYLLEADALRRRQLWSAFLHGSRRNWRERRRVWPAVIVGVIIIVAVILAAMAVIGAFRQQQENQREQQQTSTDTTSPAITPSGRYAT